MDSINFFIELLEKEILNIEQANKKMKDNVEIINKAKVKLDENNILNLDSNEYFFIESFSNQLSLTGMEKQFLKVFTGLNQSQKKAILSFGLQKEQKLVLLSIKRKLETLELLLTRENGKEPFLYQQLLLTIKNESDVIDNFELIEEIVSSNDISLKDQIDLLLAINGFNIKFYSNKINEYRDNNNSISKK